MIILSSRHCKIGEHLKKIIQDKLPGIEVEQVDSILNLSKKLTRPLNKISILVTFVDGSNDISNLISLRPLLDNTKQILILPDRSIEMMESGLQLAPSFISYDDSDLMNVFSVIKKIFQKQK